MRGGKLGAAAAKILEKQNEATNFWPKLSPVRKRSNRDSETTLSFARGKSNIPLCLLLGQSPIHTGDPWVCVQFFFELRDLCHVE